MTGNDTRAEWPPPESEERLRRYARNLRLYLGEHEGVFVGSYKFTYDAGREYVQANLFRKLTNLLAGRLMGDGIDVSVPEDAEASGEWIDQIRKRCLLDRLFVLGAIGASYRGDACFKVRYDADERRIIISDLDPGMWFPEFAPLDQTRVVAGNIDQLLHQGKADYLWRERHELRGGEGWIVNKLWRLDGDSLGGFRYDPTDDEVDLKSLEATAALLPEQPTGVAGLLVTHVPNVLVPGKGIWGLDDYTGLEPVQGELNNRLTQRAEVLDKHVDPVMYGPMVVDENGTVDLRRLKYFEIQPGESAPVGRITWDPQLTAVENSLRELRQDFCAVAGIDLTALLPRESGGPVSGRALRLEQQQTQAEVQRRQLTWGPGLAQLLSSATQLAESLGSSAVSDLPEGFRALDPEEITVSFGDGLPGDRMAEVDEHVALVTAGLEPKADAIAELQGITDAEAAAKLQAIRAEQKSAAPLALPGAARSRMFGAPAPGATQEQQAPPETVPQPGV